MAVTLARMLTASARLLSLLSLLQSRPHWAGGELAERMAIHPRTLRRDIDRLRQLGYPIHASTGIGTRASQCSAHADHARLTLLDGRICL